MKVPPPNYDRTTPQDQHNVYPPNPVFHAQPHLMDASLPQITVPQSNLALGPFQQQVNKI